MKIEGKTALITGGAHRVGKAITMTLARSGANVAVNYYSSAAAAQETVREAEALGVGALAIQADVGDLKSVRALVAAAADRFGAVDILVNSASIWQKTPLPMDDFAGWHRVLGVLLNGSMYLADAVAPLPQKKRGHVRVGKMVVARIVIHVRGTLTSGKQNEEEQGKPGQGVT